MLLANKKVAIIGAGPVGLMMARLLQQHGSKVTVYERDLNPQSRIWGGTLDLHEDSGQKAAQTAGLLAEYFAMAKPMGRTLADDQGQVYLITAPNSNSPEINRNDLRTILLNSLTKETVVWDRKFSALGVEKGRWVIHFENAPDEVADFVIGANGGLSRLRDYVSDAEVEDTGSYIIQGEVLHPQNGCPGIYELCQGNILMATGQGQTLVINPDNAGVMSYNVSFTRPQNGTPNSLPDFNDLNRVQAFLGEKFSSWGEPYKSLFRASSSFWGLPTRKFPLNQPWKRHRPLPLTLIGDAAHLMPPFAGQGVNTGLRDALVLFTSLTSGQHPTIAAAIDDYEQQMFSYATEAQTETSINEVVMHQPDFSFKKRFGL